MNSSNEHERFVRENECADRSGLSRSTRWRLEKKDKFPKRRRLSENTVGWLESEIDIWMKGRVESDVDR
jgi:prophage regulatory protein